MFGRRGKAGPIGLDIGATGLRLLQIADHHHEPIVVASAEYPLPPEVTNPEQREAMIRNALLDALRRHPFIGREVATALCPGEFVVKNLRVPRMPVEEMEPVVEFEARERFDAASRNMEVRFLLAGEVRHGNEMKEEVIVFAADDQVVRGRIRLLESCKLRPVSIDLAPCAMTRGFMRFLRRAADGAAVNVFLDVGWRCTAIVFTRGAEISFLKIIDVGGRHLTEVVASALSIPLDEALRLRVRILSDHAKRRTDDQPEVPGDLRATVADAEAPLVERLNREVQLCLRYFAVTFRGQPPSSITFVGGDAREPILARIVGESCDIPCTVGNPLKGIAGATQAPRGDRRASQPAWAVATGLALRGSPWVQGPVGDVPAVAGTA